MPVPAPGTNRVLRKGNVRLTDQSVLVGCQPAHAGGEPVVRVRTDDATGRVEQIEIRCRCGEVIVVDCDYDDAASHPLRNA